MRILFLLFFLCSNAFSFTRICVSDNTWYPYTFTKQNTPKGIHIDIIKEAFRNIGVHYSITPMTWLECLKEARRGKYDATIMSFAPNRAKYFYYPKHATLDEDNINKLDYVVIVPVADSYNHVGGWTNDIPRPVRVVGLYSIGTETKDHLSISIDDSARNDEQNLLKMLRDNNGSAIMVEEIFHHLAEKERYVGRFRVSGNPIKTKAYFLAYSKRSNLSYESILEAWKAIRSVRENKNTMKIILNRYEH